MKGKSYVQNVENPENGFKIQKFQKNSRPFSANRKSSPIRHHTPVPGNLAEKVLKTFQKLLLHFTRNYGFLIPFYKIRTNFALT